MSSPSKESVEALAAYGTLLKDHWHQVRHEHQQPPSDAYTWYLQAGIGSGKTAAASYEYAIRLLQNPGYRLALLSTTNSSIRQTMLGGVSGILTIIDKLMDGKVYTHHHHDHIVTLQNGSIIQYFTSENPETIRGPEFHSGWIDEPASLWRADDCYQLFKGRIRLDSSVFPRIIITGTPKNVPIINRISTECRERNDYVETNANTFDNRIGLSTEYLDDLVESFQGTRYWEQEIEGKLIQTAEGALWNHTWFQHTHEVPVLDEIAIAVDPADSYKGDEAGIITGGRSRDGLIYILADDTRHGSYNQWKHDLTAATRKHSARVWLVEKTIGQSMVDALEDIKREEELKNVRIIYVTAQGSKATRAEPAAARYEQGKVYHVAGLHDLESECVTWAPGDSKSPNRIDALSYLVQHLTKRKSTGFMRVPNA